MTRFATETAAPPVAARHAKVDLVHGERRADDYFWLRDKSNPSVAAYLEAENAHADALMRPTVALQQALYDEMLGRIQETDQTAPYPERGFRYYSRTVQGLQYPIHCRSRDSGEGAEHVLLDLNLLASGKPFLALGAFAVSDDNALLAYATDDTGFREYTLEVKDLERGALLPLRIPKVASACWAADSRTLFYTVEDDTKRSCRLYSHRLGTDAHALVYEEGDERFSVYVGRTRSGSWLLLNSSSHTTSEMRCLPAAEPDGAWRVIAPREQDQEYEVDHQGERFLIRVNDTGRNFRLVEAPVATPGREHWNELVAHRPEVMIEGVDAFRDFVVLLERQNGLPRMRVLLTGGSEHEVRFPEAVYAADPGPNREWGARHYRYVYQSLTTPASVYDWDVEAQTATLVKRTPVLGPYDPADYVTERLWASAADGVKVPISVVHRRDFVRDGSRPVHLYGYGAYGYSLPIAFSSVRLSLLERGFAFAIAHVRGGGDLGKPWHDDGRMLKKRNTFTDFIACAELLLQDGYTSRARLVIEGGSAGGLLMGAAINLRPDLFGAVVSKVPFVDVVNSMLDESLPLTVGEFEEWGNPKKRDEYDYINSYCPYTNLAPRAYPAMLVKTAFNDSQVMYWEPAKYVARLRTLKTDRHVLLLKTNMAAGHGGASGRYDYLRELAFDYAFILTAVEGPTL